MKKMCVFCVVAGIMSISAQAAININWFGSVGFYNYNEPAGNPADPAGYINNAGGTAIAYLLWSPDSTRDTINAGSIAGGGTSGLITDDQVLDSVAVNNAPYGDYSNGAELYSGTYNGVALDLGYVYLRIIDMSAPGGAIAQYFDSSVLKANLYNAGAPVVQNLDNNVSPGAVGNQMIAVVPEPATYAFVGLGAVLLAIRRLRRA